MKSVCSEKVPVPIGLVGTLGFLGLASLFRDFVLDDAFIIYRYAQHLAHGQGLVWNVGEAPVQGYTSFLWVALNALGILLHVDPVIFSKLLSLLAAVAVIWLLTWSSRDLPWSLAAILVAAVALSPPFAFLSMQGLETALTTLLNLGTAVLAFKIVEHPGARRMVFGFGLAFLAAWSRPDTIAFSGGVLMGLALVFLVRRELKILRFFSLTGTFFAALGVLYLVWEAGYFGSLLPTTYYVKLNWSRSLLKRAALEYGFSFFKLVLWPYLALALLLLKARFTRDFGFQAAPVAAGLLCFGLYLLTVYPLQGHLWRFIFPVFPVILFLLAKGFADLKPEISWLKKPWLAALLVGLCAGWSLHLLPAAQEEQIIRIQEDRVLAGQALAGLPGTMLVSESGALPYYSGWKALDTFGLSSAVVARRGLNQQVLNSLNPDLIMLVDLSGKYRPDAPLEKIINSYLLERRFIAVAALHKSRGVYHFYFARPDSGLFQEIVKRLTHISGVEYGDLASLLTVKEIPVYSRP